MSLYSWLIRYSRQSSAGAYTLKLFCFPPAGADASFYRNWSKWLPEEIDLYAIQLPGRGIRIRESLITDWYNLTPILIKVLQPHLQQPFAFFGHSFGTLLSFELAHQLRLQHCVSPQYLFVSGCKPPHISRIQKLSQEEEAVLIDSLREYGGTPDIVLKDSKLMALFLKIYRADLTLHDQYISQHTHLLNTPILALAGEEDSEVNSIELAQWRQYTSNSFRSQTFSGKHMYLMHKPEIVIRSILDYMNL